MPLDVSGAVSEATWFAPDVLNNRQLDEPFEVLLEPLSSNEADALDRQMGGALLSKNPDARNVASQSQKLLKRLFRDRVKEARGLVLRARDGSVLAQPSTGEALWEDLYKHASPSFRDAVIGEIESALRDHSRLDENVRPPFGS